MRHAVLALLLLAAIHPTPASADPAAAARAAAADATDATDDPEARRLVEAAADALGRLPAVAYELRTDDGNVLTVLREAGVGLQATTPNDGVLILGDEAWDRGLPDTPWKRGPLPVEQVRAFLAEMDAGGAPLTAEGMRALLARSRTVAFTPPTDAPPFAAPAPVDMSAEPCTLTAIALQEAPGAGGLSLTVELQLCAEDAELLSATGRYTQKDGSVRTEHTRYFDAGERRVTRP